MADEPKKGLLIVAKPDDGPSPLPSPDDDMSGTEPDADDMVPGGGPDATCATCYAFAPSSGRCQRFPPHGMEWSQVDPGDYCCEYKKGPQHDGAGGGDQMSQQAGGQSPMGSQYGGGTGGAGMGGRQAMS